MGKKKNKEYTGGQMHIILSVPENTVKLKIRATTLIGDKLEKAEAILSCDEINDAREDYLLLDPSDDAFDVYEFTPEFKKFIEEKEANGFTLEEIYLINGPSYTRLEVLIRDALIVGMLLLLGEHGANSFWLGGMTTASALLVGIDLIKGE